MPSVLITGTSSGFGLLTAIELAERNWHVTATMRDLSKRAALDGAAAAAKVSDRIAVTQLDVADAQSIDRFFLEGKFAAGSFDAVVHNAGIAVGGAFEDLTIADARRVMEVNFFGVLALTQKILPAFRERGRGRIVIVSSEIAFAGQPGVSAYAASKWAVEGWAEALAGEIRPFGVEVILVEPGAFRTNIWDSAPRIIPQNSPYWPMLDHLDKAVAEHVANNTGDPRDVAKVIANALEAHKPKFRYPVGRTARIAHFLRGKIPSRAVHQLFRGYFGLNRLDWPARKP